MRLLIIDDDETFLRKMEKLLTLEQHSVVTTTSGEKALVTLKENEVDLILMDLKMPGLAGVDLIRKIRDQGYNSFIIMITGYGTIESAVEITKAGAYDYILKPFDFSILLQKLAEVESEIKLRQNLTGPRNVEEIQTSGFSELQNLDEYNSPFLVISDENPSEFIKKFKILQVTPLWLSHNEERNAIPPTKLHMLKAKIEDFVKRNEKGTIILKGIETLLEIHQWDDFKRFLIYLQSDIISSNFSLLLLLQTTNITESPYQSLLHDALSLLVNPTFHNIIELISHPLRKDIITLLKTEENLNFNKIFKKLNVDRSSILAFHINKLVQESILDKNENFYSLSARGSYIAELISLLEKLGFHDPHSQIKVFNI